MNNVKEVVVGTQVYGPVNESSDIDIVLRSDFADDLSDKLSQYGIDIYRTEEQERRNYLGYYFNIGSLTFNIIVAATNEELKCWGAAKEQMLTMMPIKDREKRIETFSKFFKQAVEELGVLESSLNYKIG